MEKIPWEIKYLDQLVRRKLDRKIGEVLQGTDVTRMQSMMIGYIAENQKLGDVWQKDIEGETCIRRSTATVLLQALEKKGLVVRSGVEYDKRLKRLALSEEGLALNERIMEIFRRFDRWIMEGISEEEEKAFLTVAEKLKLRLESEEEWV